MPTVRVNNRTFDARPDRIDLRDRAYQPRLVSLPNRFPDADFIGDKLLDYTEKMVLDQGSEGACTGFGLAAAINFLLWKKNGYDAAGLQPVSPRMLYQLARIYDEWPGEDYSGSSCRGAMRGWHRHGVCSASLWPYRDRDGSVTFVEPDEGWEADAARTPLGAYYRIDKHSIADMQAAIREVGAIYASARVHSGWFLGRCDEPSVIPYTPDQTGGHAFAIGGYTDEGFLVQNSWGTDWGYHGFAYLSYEDWVENGSDAWVAVLGAPMQGAAASDTFSSIGSGAAEFGRSTWITRGARLARDYPYKKNAVRPASEQWAYHHSLVLGNNGRPINKLIGVGDVDTAIDRICLRWPKAFFDRADADTPPRLAIYVHGGLNSEEDSIKRIRMLGPYFEANGIYPLFITWRSGLMESIKGIVADEFGEVFRAQPDLPQEALAERLKDLLGEARDRTIEVACEQLLVKPVWTEMKQNAEAAGFPDGGVSALVKRLLKLEQQVDGLQFHLIGHSAGSIVLGHLLSRARKKLTIGSATLWAPACTLEFAVRHYGKAHARGALPADRIFVDNLTDERERADSVGPYGKSLLYLVSRALETRHKTPLMGMQLAWQEPEPDSDHWNDAGAVEKSLQAWLELARQGVQVRWHSRARKEVSNGNHRIPLSHGSFDNDVDVVTKTLKRITGRDRLAARVDNLDY